MRSSNFWNMSNPLVGLGVFVLMVISAWIFVGLILYVIDEKEEVSSNVEEVYFKSRVLMDSLVFNEKEEVLYYDHEPFNGVMTTDNYGSKAEIKVSNGKFNGLAKSWFENGQLSGEANYKDGELDGLAKSWFENGQLTSEGNYKNGYRDGLWKSWHENGQLRFEENFKVGSRDGLHKWWDENGQFKREAYYKDGKLISQKCSDEEGNEIDCPD